MQGRKRLRELGIRIGRLTPGRDNAITDVPGVEVGHCTIIEGEGKLEPGRGPVRTGVTAIKPHAGNLFREKVTAACHVINGFGKSVGLPQIRELGVLETPILLTNTLNVGLVADALIDYMLQDNPEIGITTGTVNPVVGECNDGYLNDIQGRHVRREHVFTALEKTAAGPVKEGTVGAGTGMTCFGFKGGIGTSSRRIETGGEEYTIGVLVLSNFGSMENLLVAGVPVGRELKKRRAENQRTSADRKGGNPVEDGSIIVVLATDLPLTSRQLGRLARRVTPGLGRVGSVISHGSGDFVLAFSTAHKHRHDPAGDWYEERKFFLEGHRAIDDAFLAVVEATEEAVLNSLFCATTVVGRDGHRRDALPVEEVLSILRDYGIQGKFKE